MVSEEGKQVRKEKILKIKIQSEPCPIPTVHKKLKFYTQF